MSRHIVMSLLVAACLLAPANVRSEDTEDPGTAAADSARAIAEKQEELEKRIAELEAAKVAHEDATRTIIRQALDKSGSQINAFVVFGGTFEYMAGWQESLERRHEEGMMGLNTAELDFEISINSWTLANVIFEYDDGTDHAFVTTEGNERSVDRINVDTATLNIGDTSKVIPYLAMGRMIVPFGISTGNPVADVLTLEDPLTLEAFETKEDALVIGFGFPTPRPPDRTPRMAPPPVRPKFLSPFVKRLSRVLGHRPPPPMTAKREMEIPSAPPPTFDVAAFFFQGDTYKSPRRDGWRPGSHIGGTVGFRSRWIDADIDYTSSIFDSRFLGFEYRSFLDDIGLVPGMASTIRANLGPVPLIAEWNGATKDVRLTDGLGRRISIRPRAWQVSIGYQFDWNRWMQSPGSEGTYLAVGYSESQDLAGVTALDVDGDPVRVGQVPERKFLATAGEWVWPGVRFAVGYSHTIDYDGLHGGTGRSADAITTMFTFEW